MVNDSHVTVFPVYLMWYGWCANASAHRAGVIVLSEDLHRIAYNAAFEHFEVRCNGEGSFADWQVIPLDACPSHSDIQGRPCRIVTDMRHCISVTVAVPMQVGGVL